MSTMHDIGMLLRELESSLRMLKIRTPIDYEVGVHVSNRGYSIDAWYWITVYARTEEAYFATLEAFSIKKDVNNGKRSTYTDQFAFGEKDENILEIYVPDAWCQQRVEEKKEKDAGCLAVSAKICPQMSPEQKRVEIGKLEKFIKDAAQ